MEEIAAAYEEGYRDVEAAKKVQNAERRAQSAVFEGSGDVEADTKPGIRILRRWRGCLRARRAEHRVRRAT